MPNKIDTPTALVAVTLKPCMCGGQAVIYDRHGNIPKTNKFAGYVRCKACGMSSTITDGAILTELWNARAPTEKEAVPFIGYQALVGDIIAEAEAAISFAAEGKKS